MKLVAALFACLILVPAGSARADDRAEIAPGTWLPHDTPSPGCNGLVRVMQALPGGAGVLIGGAFSRCGDVEAHGIVRFDGQQFVALGAGAENGVRGGSVRAIVLLPDNELLIGGAFTQAGTSGGRFVARFDGQAWHALPGNGGPQTAVSALHPGPDGTVYAASAESFEPVLGGQVLRYAGGQWQVLGSFDGSVNTLAWHAGQLYAAGDFDLPVRKVAALDSNGQWSQVGALSPNSMVRDLLEVNGELLAGGGGIVGGNVIRLVGNSWQPVSATGNPGSVRRLFHDGSRLWAAGSSAGVVQVLQQGQWTAVGEQLFDPRSGSLSYTLAALGDRVLVGGYGAAQQPALEHLLAVSGSSLAVAPVLANPAPAPAVYGALSELFTVGDMLCGRGSELLPAPDAMLDSDWLSCRSNGVWHTLPLPDGLRAPVQLQDVVGTPDGLYVGVVQPGADGSGGIPEFKFFRYTAGQAWQAMDYPPGRVLQVGENVGYLVGFTTQLGTALLEAGTRLPDGSYESRTIFWPQRCLTGVCGNAEVSAMSLTRAGADLILAGPFDGGVLRITDSSNASVLGAGLVLPESVLPASALQTQLLQAPGGLYVSGPFVSTGDGVPVNGIAHFDGSAWRTLAGGVGNARVFNLAELDGQLYVHGQTTGIGPLATGLAQWTGSRWRSLDGGIAAQVSDMTALGDQLQISGLFTLIDQQPTRNLASWRPEGSLLQDGFE